MAPTTAVTAANALFTFYDIESLQDAFTVATFTPRSNTVELFFLLEPGSPAATGLAELLEQGPQQAIAHISRRIFEANPALKVTAERPRTVVMHDLATESGVSALATRMGLFEAERVNDRASTDVHGGRFRPVCDTWSEYDPINLHPYLAGYNSLSYDTTMLALFFHEAMFHVRRAEPFEPVSPATMRAHNDELFSEEHIAYMPSYLTQGKASIVNGTSLGWGAPAAVIRKAMIDSGRHIDVSRLNEGQRMVSLKRLLGGLGRQILESDKLGGHNARLDSLDDLLELLGYNVSDVVGLSKLFEHPAFSSTFDLKKGLLDEYPETIYNAKKGTSRPDVRPGAVRMNRLTPDSTSAKFVAFILAPYKALTDIPAVSFDYPSERVAKERGIERRNVLADAIAFFKENVDDSTPQGKAAHDAFMSAMDYYKRIEGKNFNDAQGYVEANLNQVPRTPNNLPYYYADGSPSTCFVTFSTGGIHGAEYAADVYERASADIDTFNAQLAEVRSAFPEPLDFWEAHPGKAVFTTADGTELTRAKVLTSATSLKLLKAEVEAREALEEQIAALEAGDEADAAEKVERLWADHAEQYGAVGYRPDKPRPALFEKNANGSTKLKPQFNYTSAAQVIHEDFSSYYPNMLRNMSAFYNPDLGEDRYAKIFEDKERYGRQMKAPGLDPAEKTRLGVLRNGTKLILNSASGAGDTTHPNPIRMNNQIISMRIIGQLFSWRVGQAQTLAGARIVSTNTDGLYSVLDEETNNRVLAEQAALINVEIEPEPLWLVSKDSNNRLELELPSGGTPLHEAQIISASGGTLACHKGPQPTKSLAHPAVLDWALARYLREIAGGRTIGGARLSLSEPMNRDVAMWLMTQARDGDEVLAARLFQNVLAASAGKITYPFATRPDGTSYALQHINRVFIMRPGTPGTVSIQAAGAWVVNAASVAKRKANGESPVVMHDPVASPILEANGWTRYGSGGTKALPADQDVAVRRVPRLDPEWSMYVDNRDLVELDAAVIRAEILDHLDLDAYVDMLAATFEENWMNQPARD